VKSLYRCLHLKEVFFGPTLTKICLQLLSLSNQNIRNIFQVCHLEPVSVLQPEKGQEEFSTKKLLFLLFFHTNTVQEFSLDNALDFCFYGRLYLLVLVGERFHNSAVPSRNVFKIDFICFTNVKGAGGDSCRSEN